MKNRVAVLLMVLGLAGCGSPVATSGYFSYPAGITKRCHLKIDADKVTIIVLDDRIAVTYPCRHEQRESGSALYLVFSDWPRAGHRVDDDRAKVSESGIRGGDLPCEGAGAQPSPVIRCRMLCGWTAHRPAGLPATTRILATLRPVAKY